MGRSLDLYKHLFVGRGACTKISATMQVPIEAQYPEIGKLLARVKYMTTSREPCAMIGSDFDCE